MTNIRNLVMISNNIKAKFSEIETIYIAHTLLTLEGTENKDIYEIFIKFNDNVEITRELLEEISNIEPYACYEYNSNKFLLDEYKNEDIYTF